MTNTTLALGSKVLNQEGAIVSRLSSIEDMASMSILCSDKVQFLLQHYFQNYAIHARGCLQTGTLTTNHMEIQSQCFFYQDNLTRHALLRYCAMAAKWNDPPRDAIDKMVLEAVDMPSMSTCTQFDYMPFDPV